MSSNIDRLYDLLPPVYRQLDAGRGYPLQQLLQVIAEQVNVVETDIAQLYANWFIETCQDWVVPYLGDLIGHRPLHEATQTASTKILVQRMDVADTIGFRRRKGTLALLEQMAGSVAGWPARVVEFAPYLSVTQELNHIHLDRGRIVDLRVAGSLDLLGSPFDTLAHTLDVRGVSSPQCAGCYSVPSVALFVWRLKAYPVTRSHARRVDQAGDHCYTFSALGNDVPLFNQPISVVGPINIAGELDLPTRIRRQAFAEPVVKDKKVSLGASMHYYGEGRSVAIWAGDWAGCDPSKPIPAAKIVPANLSGWKYYPRPGHVAVDPELGRIAFPLTQVPEHEVRVSYYYAFSADMGGGEYLRPTLMYPNSKIYCVGKDAEFTHIRDAHEQWFKDKPNHAVIEITDSGVYSEQIHLQLAKDQYLELRAGNGMRPVILLHESQAPRPDALTISGQSGSNFTLDGVIVTGRGVEVRGQLDQLTIRHSTLVPGWALRSDCAPRMTEEPSLELVDTSASIRIEHSILGAISVIGGQEREWGPNRLHVSDSVVDATSEEGAAIYSPGEAVAPLTLTVKRCTIFGRVETHAIDFAENSIFSGKVFVARRQMGCMRFCYVPSGSRTPERYYCQPDLTNSNVKAVLREDWTGSPDAKRLRAEERIRVEPEFASTRYGEPDYCRLTDRCAIELKMGADDQSEMGVFHDLFEAQRESNLRARLEEYTPAGMEAGILYAS